MEFLYIYDYKDERDIQSIDSMLLKTSEIILKEMKGYKKIKSKLKYDLSIDNNEFEGFYDVKTLRIRLLFKVERRNSHIGILCTVAPPQYYKMQDSIINNVFFYFPFLKK